MLGYYMQQVRVSNSFKLNDVDLELGQLNIEDGRLDVRVMPIEIWQ